MCLHHRLLLAIFVATLPSLGLAESCKAFLAPDTDQAFIATVVTVDGNGSVSYASDFMEYHAKGEPTGPSQLSGEPWWGNTGTGPTGTAAQLFSDRLAGDTQPFAVSRKDLINIAITYEDSPHVTITLRSWGNVKGTFVADCSPDGMMYGVHGHGSRTFRSPMAQGRSPSTNPLSDPL